MPARPPPPSASSTTPASPTRSVRCMRAQPRWTGWFRSRSAASPSLPLPPPATGATARPRRIPWRTRRTAIASTSSTPRATSTSPSRCSALCACWTVLSPFWLPRAVSSPSPRRSGVRQMNTRSPAWSTSTRWTPWAPTSSTASRCCTTACTPTAWRSSCPSAARTPSRASSTWST